MWNALLKVKDLYLKGRIVKIGNGLDTDFWRDLWCGPISLKDKFQELFAICNEQAKGVASMAVRRWRLTFRRWLDERTQTQLRQLRDMLTSCVLSSGKDVTKWKWEKSEVCSVKLMYSHLCSDEVEAPHKKLWKARIPLKIKIFMWLIQQNSILT